ncbi:MAG: hypothetical protein AB1586_09690 [Pseudomonadota bacterium]
MGVVVQANKNPQDRHLDILNHVDYRLAETDADKDEIYRMRYRAYLNEGAIEPRADGRLTDRFDDRMNSWTFGIYIDGVLASSIRISVATPDNPVTPAVDAFPDLLEPELARGKIIVDPNRFVAEPARARRFPELPYVTVRLGYVACAYFQADLGTATVRKEHQAFYRRVFLQNPLCEPRPYPTLTKPLSLMAAEYAVVRDRIFERYPYFRSTFFERRMLFERRLAPPTDTIVSLPEPAMNVASIVPRG